MPRSGFLTPSTFKDLMTNNKQNDGLGKSALAVVDNLVLDLLGIEREETATPQSCQWGIDHEWEAIKSYEEKTFRTVQAPVDFKVSSTHSFVGGTMDGLVGNKLGGVEVKCPSNSINHLDNITSHLQFETIYKYQLQGYFWIFELDWIDCISYDPRLPEPFNITLYRVFPNEEIIEQLKSRCTLAYNMALEKVEHIKRIQNGASNDS